MAAMLGRSRGVPASVSSDQVRADAADAARQAALQRLHVVLEASRDIVLMLDEGGRITERKATERALRASKKALLASQWAARLGTWTFDPASLQIEWSEELYAMYGLDPAAEPVTIDNTRDLVHPDDRGRYDALVRLCLAADTPFKIELRGIRRGGAIFHQTTWGEIEVGEDGTRRLIGTTQDITERKQAEAEKASLEAQLAQAQKMESVGRLAGGVAHDFNNMLAVILGNVEFALADAEPGSPLASDLLEIEKAARHSAELTRQLLAFARVQPVSPEVLDLNGALTATLAMLGRLIGEEIHLAFDPGPDPWPVRIDRSQLEAVLTNLVVNARDAITGVGTIRLATANVTLDAAAAAAIPDALPGEYVTLTVSDSGEGMTPEVMAHIFEPFYTTKPLGQGTGLGLSTVYGSLHQAGGFVTVASTPGAGATFTLYLPRHDEPAAAGRGAADPAALGGPETILLVEDEPAVLRLAVRGLEAAGYTVIAAAGPAAALRLAAGQPGGIDLVLTDVVMPDMRGPDLVAALRATRPNLRPVYMSGYPAGQLVDDDSRFLAKPFTLADLLGAVRATLDEA